MRRARSASAKRPRQRRWRWLHPTYSRGTQVEEGDGVKEEAAEEEKFEEDLEEVVPTAPAATSKQVPTGIKLDSLDDDTEQCLSASSQEEREIMEHVKGSRMKEAAVAEAKQAARRARAPPPPPPPPRRTLGKGRGPSPKAAGGKAQDAKGKGQRGSLQKDPATCGTGVAVDFHKTLEIGGTVPQAHLEAMDSLVKGGLQVTVLSFAGQQRGEEVKAHLASLRPHCDDWQAEILRDPCGRGGKAHYCLDKGIDRVVDDNAAVLSECLAKGLRIYPITTKWEPHLWAQAKGICVYPNLPAAVAGILREAGLA